MGGVKKEGWVEREAEKRGRVLGWEVGGRCWRRGGVRRSKGRQNGRGEGGERVVGVALRGE